MCLLLATQPGSIIMFRTLFTALRIACMTADHACLTQMISFCVLVFRHMLRGIPIGIYGLECR